MSKVPEIWSVLVGGSEGKNGAGDADPFGLPPLVEGSCDKKLLEDPGWLVAMHNQHELSIADIARLCGVSYGTVRVRFDRFDLDVKSHHGKRSRIAER